jgi:hypothetical protein
MQYGMGGPGILNTLSRIQADRDKDSGGGGMQNVAAKAAGMGLRTIPALAGGALLGPIGGFAGGIAGDMAAGVVEPTIAQGGAPGGNAGELLANSAIDSLSKRLAGAAGGIGSAIGGGGAPAPLPGNAGMIPSMIQGERLNRFTQALSRANGYGG